MIGRRSFIKNIILATVAPTILVPVLDDKFKWKIPFENKLILNPNWINASYEIWFLGYEFIDFTKQELNMGHTIKWIK